MSSTVWLVSVGMQETLGVFLFYLLFSPCSWASKWWRLCMQHTASPAENARGAQQRNRANLPCNCYFLLPDRSFEPPSCPPSYCSLFFPDGTHFARAIHHNSRGTYYLEPMIRCRCFDVLAQSCRGPRHAFLSLAIHSTF